MVTAILSTTRPLMIETIEGLQNAAEIAEVEGVAALFPELGDLPNPIYTDEFPRLCASLIIS